MNKLAYGSTHRWLPTLKKPEISHGSMSPPPMISPVSLATMPPCHHATVVDRVEQLPEKLTGLFVSLTK
ncbi:MAG: hypothetical protein Q8K05_02140 [Polaromonas sp.]|uniref:hypothetical protein n=1 Tax=Polaromonas sp. TaxID=1869339 RepID=UPI00272F394E|nr:hypothetical protein [Polaromonas sp.]MDP2254851.1 hypothetical protein [Polaromonas sp.]